MNRPANRFLDLLRRFNRKERFYLVAHALGKPDFGLSETFRAQLSSKVGVSVPRENCFVAMDYHLNWIYAAAWLSPAEGLVPDTPIANPVVDETAGLRIVQGNQEDIDLVVAFADGDNAHVLLVEAKGVTSWDNKQLASKAKRLKSIFGLGGDNFDHVDPHFVIVSPVQSHALQTMDWPQWMLGEKVAWLEMSVPQDLLLVTRCNADKSVSRDGDHWKVMDQKKLVQAVVTEQSAESATG